MGARVGIAERAYVSSGGAASIRQRAAWLCSAIAPSCGGSTVLAMANPVLCSTPRDLRGEAALAALLPQTGRDASEVLVVAKGLEKVDAFTACALRALIEYYARRRATRVTLSPPDGTETYRTLWHLLGEDLPRHFCFSNDASPPAERAPRTVLLPATVIDSFSDCDRIADLVPRLCEAMPTRPVRLVAGAFAELVGNGLFHADDSPIGVVASIFHEPDEHALQLVVTDLGGSVAREPDAAVALSSCIAKSEQTYGGLAGLADQIGRFGGKLADIEARISIASGNGRLEWSNAESEWTTARAQHVEGFTASVSFRL